MYLAAEILFYIFLFTAFAQLFLSIVSLRSGLLFHKYVNSRLNAASLEFGGPVTVFIPCRGTEPGLEENLRAVMSQNRRGLEAVFVVDSLDDPAVSVIERVIANFENARLFEAEKARTSGQKVHNLIRAVKTADKASTAFVFVDSDARPSPFWLENLLSPLNDPGIGCSSGYRWFVPESGGFATHLRSAWNASIASALGPDNGGNFCWGGSSAVRASVFHELDIVKHWEGTVSDDFVLTNCIRRSHYKIHFEPKCLIPTVEDCTLGELFEFTTRQMKITRRYSPGHFKISLIGSGIFAMTFILGLVTLAFSSGLPFWLVAGLLAVIWSLGTFRAMLRVNTIINCMPEHAHAIRGQFISHGLLWPFSTVLFLVNDVASLFSNRITWRGITYELVSENEIRILDL